MKLQQNVVDCYVFSCMFLIFFIGLQNDAFALTRAGEMSTVTLLQLVAAYKNETDYTGKIS